MGLGPESCAASRLVAPHLAMNRCVSTRAPSSTIALCVALVSVATWPVCASAFESTLDAVPCRPMPESVYRLLREGINSFQPNPRFLELETKNKAEALAVFERWRRAPWSVLTALLDVRNRP